MKRLLLNLNRTAPMLKRWAQIAALTIAAAVPVAHAAVSTTVAANPAAGCAAGQACSGTTITSTVGFSIPSGTATAPGAYFTSAPTVGLFLGAGNVLGFSSGNNYVAGMYSTTFALAANTNLIWTNSNANPGATADSNFSRLAAGEIGLGNGTAGSVAGTLSLTTLKLNTTSNISASSGIQLNASGGGQTFTRFLGAGSVFGQVGGATYGYLGLQSAPAGTAAIDAYLWGLAAGTFAIGGSSAGDFSGTLKLTTLQGGTTLTLNNASSGTLTIGSNAVTPASSGTRYLCISTAGVVTSSASACSGT